MAGTTADKLQGIIDAKADIASAITAKGGTVPSLFEDYGDAIRALPSGGTPVISSLNVTPSTSAQTITAPSGTDGYSPINVSAVTSSIDSNIQAGNIKSGTTILGVTGTYSGNTPALSGLVVVPSTSAQTLTPTVGIDGFNQVNVNAVTSSIDQNISAGNIKSGIEILGVTGTYEGGGGGSDKFGPLVDRSISGAVTASDLSGLTSIGSYAFNSCTNLTSVTIPDSVTSIGANAFQNCTGLTSVAIGSGVTSIGTDAFTGCTSLATITCDSSNQTYSASNNFLLNKAGTSIAIVPGGATSLSIPSGVTSTGSGFKGNTVIQSLTIPDSVTGINANAFQGCSSLESVTIGNGVTSIPTYAFQTCTSLTSITLPDSVTSIGQFAFSSCSSLQSIVFGSGITTINQAFGGCSSCLLYDFREAQQVPTLSTTNAFNQTNANKKIVVPDALYNTWVTANNWKSSTNGIVTAITKASDYNP